MKDAKEGIVVAGGHGQGNGVRQLWHPQGVIVDQLGTIYVADEGNNRVMCWVKGATEGSIVVDGNEDTREVNQLRGPHGLSFDKQNNLYITDLYNYRVQKFNVSSNI
jgi:hypothetical protein